MIQVRNFHLEVVNLSDLFALSESDGRGTYWRSQYQAARRNLFY